MSSSNTFSFRDTVPPSIYLDANFVLAVFAEKNKFHRQCAEFIQKLERNSVPSFLSPLVLDEVCYGIIRAGLKDSLGDNWSEIRKQNPAVIVPLLPTIEHIHKQLKQLTFIKHVSINTSTGFQAANNIVKYHLLPRDALHLAIMQLNRIDYIATIDKDFGQAVNIKIYTCNKKLLYPKD